MPWDPQNPWFPVNWKYPWRCLKHQTPQIFVLSDFVFTLLGRLFSKLFLVSFPRKCLRNFWFSGYFEKGSRTNQIAPFFKFECLSNHLGIWVDIFQGDWHWLEDSLWHHQTCPNMPTRNSVFFIFLEHNLIFNFWVIKKTKYLLNYCH